MSKVIKLGIRESKCFLVGGTRVDLIHRLVKYRLFSHS